MKVVNYRYKNDVDNILKNKFHCLFLSVWQSTSSFGRKFNPQILELIKSNEKTVSLETNELRSYIFSKHIKEKCHQIFSETNNESQFKESAYIISGEDDLCFSFLETNTLLSDDNKRLEFNIDNLVNLLQIKHVDQVIFADFYPFHSGSFVNVLRTFNKKVCLKCPVSVAVIGGLNNFSSTDQDNEKEAILEAVNFYTKEGFETHGVNKVIDFLSLKFLLVPMLDIRRATLQSLRDVPQKLFLNDANKETWKIRSDYYGLEKLIAQSKDLNFMTENEIFDFIVCYGLDPLFEKVDKEKIIERFLPNWRIALKQELVSQSKKKPRNVNIIWHNVINNWLRNYLNIEFKKIYENI